MDAKTRITLGDPALFRQRCYVNGAWIDAQGGGTLDVDNPATGELIGTVPALGTQETRAAIAAADAAWAGWRARPAKERANVMRRWFDLIMSNQEDLAGPDDERAGQAAGRVARGDRVRGVVRRVVRRGRQARVRRRHGPSAAGQAHRGAEGAHRGRCVDHAVEFPRSDDHEKVRAGARGRLSCRHPARVADAVLGAGSRGACRSCRNSARRGKRHHRPVWADGAPSLRPTRPSASSPSPAPPRSASC